jgi:Flp pilus assembly protein TadG
MIQRRRRRGGNALLEFTLVGIPVIFILISTVELSRGMWIYHTLAYSLKEGTRYAVVHGNDCQTDKNSCSVQIRDIAKVIQSAGMGLIPEQLANVNFTTSTRTVTCSTLAACVAAGSTGDTYFPTATPGTSPRDPGADVGQAVTITAQYPFDSAISMLFPSGGGRMVFPGFVLPGESSEQVRF